MVILRPAPLKSTSKVRNQTDGQAAAARGSVFLVKPGFDQFRQRIGNFRSLDARGLNADFRPFSGRQHQQFHD